MIKFLRLLFAPCSEMSTYTSLAMEQDLTRAQRFAVGFHFWYCKACRRYRRQIRFIREVLTELATAATDVGPLPDASLSSAARERINAALRDGK